MDEKSAIDALFALAQETRLQTFRALVRSEPDGLPAGELSRSLDIPQNTMSAHLAVLTRAGLARARRDGRSIIYRADLGCLREMTLFLLRDCCGGQAELCMPVIEALQPCCSPVGASPAANSADPKDKTENSGAPQ